MSNYHIPVTFKASPELKAWLSEEAKSGFRSVSAEVAMRLERQMQSNTRTEKAAPQPAGRSQ
ncbi:hypothetical protein HTY52_12890 [Cupriavidus taiwanensis]|uniref:hypothetical protein n=1 Tax=Cupriavidus taiwanensis TaxID=164546 RepID=UPI00157276AB|nr:hypothetical protein [Cupriavidus taiwanensis]NSX14972.1 hypothetical protein [Cupriavidus taiwanensis]